MGKKLRFERPAALGLLLGAGLAASALLAPGSATAEDLVFTSLGGALQKGTVAAMVQPAADKLKVTFGQDSMDGIENVRVQVQSGAPAWDIVQMGSDECVSAEKEGIVEPLDYKLIDAKGIPKDAYGAGWIASQYYSVVLAWNTKKYGSNPPHSWADFWDVQKFPGTRALSQYPQEMLEISLLAAGVAKDKLYPLDVEKAFAMLEKIKPSITVWWKSGSQSAQLLKDGEVDMLAIWGSRINAAIADGAAAAFTYNDGLLGYGCFAIPKGAKHKDLAMKMIALMVSPEIQANIPSKMPSYGPVNELAYGDTAKIPPELAAKANSSPENRKLQTMINAQYWGENRPEITERYKNLIIQ